MRLTLAFFILSNVCVFAEQSLGSVVVAPTFQASVEDDPKNGFPDSVALSGIVAQTATREVKNIVEFNFDDFPGGALSDARLRFKLHANNSGGAQFREFDVFVFSGDGIATLGDFTMPSTVLSRIGFSLPGYTSFDLDVLSEVQILRGQGADFIGFQFDPIGDTNFPSVVVSPTLSVTAIPEPNSIAVLAFGMLIFSFFQVRRARQGEDQRS